MKLASFAIDGRESWGVVHDDGSLSDTGSVLRDYADLKAVIAGDAVGWIAGAIASAPRYAADAIAYLPVIRRPSKIFCVGHNYESHRKETGRAKAEHPSIFVRFADSQVGHGSPLIRPAVSTMFDYEGELAVVIGKGGRAIPVESAMQHVSGYSCYMDASVRDWQWHTSQFTPGKNFPATGGFGPCLVTADELGDPATTSVTTRLNGTVVQSQSTSEMLFPIPTIINYISTFTPLSPGDVIATGTPGGVGAKREPALWMKKGDLIEVEIPGVGTLYHWIEDERK